MSDPTTAANQYTSASLMERVEIALKNAGLVRTPFDWQELSLLDQFHSRGLAATHELASALDPRRGATVLDVGCGAGGPARLLAATYGCRVTGIDLTPQIVDVASYLSARTGLDESTRFLVADALQMPFADGEFDDAWTQHAAMNIENRTQLYREIHRVLKPGGRLAMHDVVAGAAGPLIFPVPWAPTADASFLLTPEALRASLTEVGFEILTWEDKTDVTLASAPAPTAASETTTAGDDVPLPLASIVLGGPEYPHRVHTFFRNLREGRAGVIQAIAQRK